MLSHTHIYGSKKKKAYKINPHTLHCGTWVTGAGSGNLTLQALGQ